MLSYCLKMKLILNELGSLLWYGKLINTRENIHIGLPVFFRIYLLTILAVFTGAGLSLAFFHFIKMEYPVKRFGYTPDQTWSYHFILFCLAAPFTEEILFRLCLRYSKLNLAVGAGFCFLIYFSPLVKGRGIFGEDHPLSLRIGLVLIVSATVYSILQNNPVLDHCLTKFWSSHFKLIFYLSLIVFALIHVSNFEINPKLFIAAPLVTLPQLAGGFMFGYVRLKYGIVYAILLHGANNFLPFLVHVTHT